MPSRKLKQILEANHIHYELINHSPAYTAQQIAASAHIRGKEMAKTVIVKIDNELAMAVLPAAQKVDLTLLQKTTGADNVELATESDFRGIFPECELGAMPPFGNLYGMDVFVAKRLAADDEIVFNAGSHTELVRLSYADFEKVVHPKVMHLSLTD
jgi:Ala-tRNA(Pro) deacylase